MVSGWNRKNCGAWEMDGPVDRAVTGSQPSPAHGLGFSQQQKNMPFPNSQAHRASPSSSSHHSAPPVPWSTGLSTHSPLLQHPGGSRAHSALCSGGWQGASNVEQGHARLLLLVTLSLLPCCPSLPGNSLLPHYCFWKIVLKEGKEQEGKSLLHHPPFPWAELHPSGHSHDRVKDRWNLGRLLPTIHCVTLGILSGPPFLHLQSDGFRLDHL